MTAKAEDKSPSSNVPEGCTLHAVDGGDGWLLEVHDTDDKLIAILAWPEHWDTKSDKELTEMGYSVE